jgi:Kef-type K+ transport system membrane component KefB/nucleotide-binding universal stress UspA family protein
MEIVRQSLGSHRRVLSRARANSAIVILAFLFPAAAVAADRNSLAWSSEALFFIELGLLLLVGRLLGEAAIRIGQPSVIGQLIGGLVLGPSLFGFVAPQAQHFLFPSGGPQKSMIDAVAELGILMLLLITGMEADLRLVRRVGGAAITVAIAGVALPFICGFALGMFIPAEFLPKPDARLITAIFIGIALSISSVKIVAMVVREMNFMRRDLGQIIVASAILEDTIGWVIIALALGLAANGGVDPWSVGRALVGTALFMLVSLTVGRRIVYFLIRWTNDNFESDFAVITTILLIMIAMALITQLIGVNTVLGAFVAGVLVGESPILTGHIDGQLRGLISALFMPVFFGLAGLNADLTVLGNANFALLAVGLIAIASLGKFLGAFVGGKLGGLTRAESLALGCAMNARGSTEVIVASVGLSVGVLSQNLFTVIVTMAVCTTMAMPPMLRWALKRLPLRRDERLRMEREQLDEKSFVANLERLLLAADESANGKFAAQLAGMIAGSGDKPTTVLDMSRGQQSRSAKEGTTSNAQASKDEIESAAQAITTLEAHPKEERAGRVDVIARTDAADNGEAVALEAQRGYDLLIVGIQNTRDRRGGFTEEISHLTKGFEGPLVIVDAEAANAQHRDRRKILIPVNGTETSRRAVEIALTMARAGDAQVTTLYVTRASMPAAGGRRRRVARRNEFMFLKEIEALADRFGVKVSSRTRVDVAPDQAILREAERDYDLIVLGVSRRPGDTLFFGDTAAVVLDRAKTAKLFVAS